MEKAYPRASLPSGEGEGEKTRVVRQRQPIHLGLAGAPAVARTFCGATENTRPENAGLENGGPC